MPKKYFYTSFNTGIFCYFCLLPLINTLITSDEKNKKCANVFCELIIFINAIKKCFRFAQQNSIFHDFCVMIH